MSRKSTCIEKLIFVTKILVQNLWESAGNKVRHRACVVSNKHMRKKVCMHMRDIPYKSYIYGFKSG